MITKILLPLLCLFVLSSADSDCESGNGVPDFQAVPNFDASKLFGVQWYEPFYTDTLTAGLPVCTRDLFIPLNDGTIIYQYGDFLPGFSGPFDSETSLLKQEGYTGKFNVIKDCSVTGNSAVGFIPTSSSNPNYLAILDYDTVNYDWIIFGDSEAGGYITLITRTSQVNLIALQRTIELAEEYNRPSHHLQLQTPKCNYAKILWLLKKQQSKC